MSLFLRGLRNQLDEERLKSQMLGAKSEQLQNELAKQENLNAAKIESLSRCVLKFVYATALRCTEGDAICSSMLNALFNFLSCSCEIIRDM